MSRNCQIPVSNPRASIPSFTPLCVWNCGLLGSYSAATITARVAPLTVARSEVSPVERHEPRPSQGPKVDAGPVNSTNDNMSFASLACYIGSKRTSLPRGPLAAQHDRAAAAL